MADKKVMNEGLMAYRVVLEATRDVFGKGNMTSDVICTAIREAGTMAWRAMVSAESKTGLVEMKGEECEVSFEELDG